MREHVPTSLLKHVEVWEALVEHMPISALLRQLCRLSSLGLLDVGSPSSKIVLAKLHDHEAIRKARFASGSLDVISDSSICISSVWDFHVCSFYKMRFIIKVTTTVACNS